MPARPHTSAPRGGRGPLRLAAHVLFWLAALAFYTLYFGGRQNDYAQNLLFVSVLLPITIATTYFLLYWLIPRYLLTRRYGYFALYFCYTLLFSFYLELALVVTLFITVAEYQALVVQPSLTGQLDVIAGMYLVVALAVALHLLRRWYVMQTRHARLERTRLETELKLKEAELELLKSQLHPHFLFNTLNNLYGLTLERSERAPDVVLSIADMLNYMLYRGNDPRVPLEEEVEYIRNYIALERLRHDARLKVHFEVEGQLEGYSLAPLLLMPFVENSFKHGAISSEEGGWIRLSLALRGSLLHFTVENPKRPASNRDDASSSDASSSERIGLKNVRRRLAHLYPDRYSLDITENDHRYGINLTLNLAESDEDTLPHRR